MIMEFFFNPDGIAIIGASATPGKGGYNILHNLVGNYKGHIYPVNPRYGEILGLECYPDIDSIPEPFELAIFYIPAAALPETIEACAHKGVRGIIIESAGFAEVGADGSRLQAECLERARRNHIRLWGPNCMGLIDGQSRHVFSFMRTEVWDEVLAPGNVSLIVQSGMLSAGFLMMMLERGGMGIRRMCSELLAHLIDDPLTAVIGLYVESLVDAPAFLRLSSSSPKPIVLLKGGKSPAGARAAASHTASLAGDHTIMRHALSQAGIIEVNDPHELMDLLRGLSKIEAWRPSGGTGIVTFSGAGGIITADLLHREGLALAELSPATMATIQGVFPDWMPPSHPVDIWPAIEQNGHEKVHATVLEAVMRDPGVDSLILQMFTSHMDTSCLQRIAELGRELDKPFLVWITGIGQSYHTLRGTLEDRGIPVFEEMHRGVSFLANTRRYYLRQGERPYEASGLAAGPPA